MDTGRIWGDLLSSYRLTRASKFDLWTSVHYLHMTVRGRIQRLLS